MVKKWALRATFSILIFSLFATGLWSLDRNGFFDVRDVIVRVAQPKLGQERLEQYLLQSTTPLFETLKGASLFRLPLKSRLAELKKNQFLKSYQIERVWPNSLIVQIDIEAVSFIALESDSFVTALLSDGRKVKNLPMAVAPDVAFVDKEIILQKDLSEKALELQNSLPKIGALSKNQISYLDYDSKNGFLASLLSSRAQVNFGFDHFQTKVQRLVKVFEYLETKRYDAQVIDGNLSKKVLVRLRKDP